MVNITKCKGIIIGLAFSLGLVHQANAGLIDVKSIEITNAINTWLQVAEVVALDTNSLDMALSSEGAVASAPDWWDGLTLPENTIDGVTTGTYLNGDIFHEGSPFSNDTLTITFPSIVELTSIQIFGRTDCCTERDLFSVSFLNEAGSELFSTQVDSRFGAHSVITLPDTSVAVPAPETISLIFIGILVLTLMRRIKNK